MKSRGRRTLRGCNSYVTEYFAAIPSCLSMPCEAVELQRVGALIVRAELDEGELFVVVDHYINDWIAGCLQNLL